VKCAVIARHRGEYPLTLMCRVLAVARSAFYAWQRRTPGPRAREDARLRVAVAATHRRSRQTYGTPRHQRELRAQGLRVSRRRLARLMRVAGLRAVAPRRWQVTTQADPALPVATNVLDRAFAVGQPNRAWGADLTYCWTGEGWLYLAAVLDLGTRRVIGWAPSATLEVPVVQRALQRALALRQPPPGLLHHSDRGSQYASRAYQAVLAAHGLTGSMSRVGNCWDNAVLESFFGTLKRELVDRSRWPTRASLIRAIADYIEGWYNRERRHSALGYLSPIAYEQRLREAA
jgi:transposase InsO family protein